MRIVVGIALVALLGVACGESSAAGSGDGVSVSIESPADGDEVKTPLEVEVTSSEPLGPTDSGRHHVHLFFDGNSDEYQGVEDTSFVVEELPAGEHTIEVSLRHADHSDAGASDSVTVTVAGTGSDDGGEQPAEDTGPD
jgi:hypothetical protein